VAIGIAIIALRKPLADLLDALVKRGADVTLGNPWPRPAESVARVGSPPSSSMIGTGRGLAGMK
jgi:hypothetical protein